MWCGKTAALAVRGSWPGGMRSRDEGGQGSTVMPISVTPVADQDWQDHSSYDCTAHLTLRGWAREFLRRNPAFHSDLLAALQQAHTLFRGALIDVNASAGDLSRWGVLAESYSRGAVVFWCPRRCARVLPVVAQQPSASPTASPFDLTALSCRATVLLRPDESQHVLFPNGTPARSFGCGYPAARLPAC
ncbi:DUF6499 domain-containing protein [Mesorhizobium sp. M1169]|uniref:transcriptional regulator domain-containing protein n=1 Tax=Mesorhizobium sp. M1169 TaxID=2957066 RepID=UPI00333CCF93